MPMPGADRIAPPLSARTLRGRIGRAQTLRVPATRTRIPEPTLKADVSGGQPYLRVALKLQGLVRTVRDWDLGDLPSHTPAIEEP
jgi:hypothetical protein